MLLLPALFPAQHSAALPSVADSWSNTINLRSGSNYLPPIHASLLPNGKILMNGKSTPTLIAASSGPALLDFMFTPTPVGQSLPTESYATIVSAPLEIPPPGVVAPPWQYFDALLCAGHAYMNDGTLFTAGGTRLIQNTASSSLYDMGLGYATKYNPLTSSWTKVSSPMLGTGTISSSSLRWYPTVTHLGDSRMLVTAGTELLVASLGQYYINRSVEAYNPSSNSWQVLSTHSESPAEIWNRDYTHVSQLPRKFFGSDILMFGEYGIPVFMNLNPTSTPKWFVSTSKRPDTQTGQSSNYSASSVLLPLRANDGDMGYANGSMLIAGGLFNSSHETNIDVYDPSTDSWKPRIDSGTHRHHPATVILPDARIAIIGGWNLTNDTTVGQVQYVDPLNNFSLAQGASNMTEVRGYHTSAVLLPDGRVFVGGGKDNASSLGGERGDFRYLSPDYMFKPRPAIWAASSSTIKYGQNFWVLWNSSTTVNDVALVSLGSMTHSFDENQRYVQLKFYGNVTSTWPNTQYAVVQAPLTPEIAPQGYYMIFVLDQQRVPSQAGIIKLTN